jgi:MFS family permease
VELTGLSIAEAWRDSALWRIAISNFVVMLLTMGLAVHLFPILTEAGVPRATAAGLLALGGAAGILGKLVTGWLLDRFRPNLVGGLTLGAAAITFALLIDGVRSPALVVVAMVVNGYAAGTKTQITGFVTAGFSGMRNFGAVYGFMSSLMALASGLGPLTAGLFYDYAGGYGPFLVVGAIGCTLGGFLMMTLPAYPTFSKKEPEAEAFV